LLDSTLKSNRVLLNRPQLRDYYWDERRFRLNESEVFSGFDQEIKRDILIKLSQHTLVSSIFIEKGAISYCTQMALTAKTLEEKMLFISMGQEEVVHLIEFEKFLSPELKQIGPTAFTTKVNELIQQNDRETSYLIAQVLLEGMSMNHYQVLWNSCIDDSMKSLIEKVLNDEARHHGSGLVLLDESPITDKQIEKMKQVTKDMLPILMGQKFVLLETIRSSAHKFGKELSPEDLEVISNQISLDAQMKDRVQKIQDSIKKLKNKDLKDQLVEVTKEIR